jgi:hypothetical protein
MPFENIALPTFAYEHKIFVGPFSRKFPKEEIWVAPMELATQPAARVLWDLLGQAPPGRKRRHSVGHRDRVEGAQLARTWYCPSKFSTMFRPLLYTFLFECNSAFRDWAIC